jgi:MoaA/NifB/PqqE/SkfB family radical SAM enzyme
MIGFFTASVRKMSLANIMGAADSRIIRFVLHHRLVRAAIVRLLAKMAERYLKRDPLIPHAVEGQRIAMARALLNSLARMFSAAQGKQIVDNTWLPRVVPALMKIAKGQGAVCESFRQQFGENPPAFFTISPTRNCNLACTGCYANAVTAPEDTLGFDVFERVLEEKKQLWGSWFTVISGGEPLMYRSQGKTIFDIFERHPDNYFLMFTNGTLINEENARRLAEVGNVTPAISVEGYEEQTDARRGKGTYARVLTAFENLRRYGVPYGVSITVFRDNAHLIDEALFERYIHQLGALYVWIFQYMPIGRQQTLDLVITPEQRLKMYRESWAAVTKKKMFIVDFWNSAEASDGCLSAGKPYGYLYIDWHGNVCPCVFNPYSPVKLSELYKEGKTLNDALQHPFFKAIRAWQKDYSLDKAPEEKGNYLTPCPIRDHYDDMLKMLKQYKPRPIDVSGEEALRDEKYQKGMAEYDKQLSKLLDPIWEKETIQPEKAMKALPDSARAGRSNP